MSSVSIPGRMSEAWGGAKFVLETIKRLVVPLQPPLMRGVAFCFSSTSIDPFDRVDV